MMKTFSLSLLLGEGWNIDSDNSAWDKMDLTATFGSLPAGGSVDLV